MVSSVCLHEGPAPRLIHRLKYGGDILVAELVAGDLVGLVPSSAQSLVPIPRVLARRWRYGVDPAVELARLVSRATGIPMIMALAAPLWSPHRAGRNRERARRPGFRRRRPAPGAVLVDDVVTTGWTIDTASMLLGSVVGAITVTSA